MAQNITLQGATYSAVPAVKLPKQGGGTATFTDVTDTTATSADVASGKYFYTAAGVKTAGTGSGGGADFLVTLSWNSNTEMWEPDATYSEMADAYDNGKTVAFMTDNIIDAVADGYYDSYIHKFIYSVRYWAIDSVLDVDIVREDIYVLGQNEFGIDDRVDYHYINNEDKTVTPTQSVQTITATPGEGYTGLGTVTVAAMPSGTATPAASISSTGATVSTGTNTLTLSKSSVSNTPQVSAGYIASGTAGNSSVSLTANVTTKAAATITPGTSNQTIASGTYLTGTQTISGDANLVAGNIKSGTTIFGVTGSYTGGGSSNWTLLGTKSLGTISTSSTTDTDTGQTIVVTGWNDYDLIVCECSVDTQTNGRHTCSTKTAWLTASSNITTKNGCTFATACYNTKRSSSGTTTSRSSTTSYGVYAKAGTISGSNLTITIYQRYNSTQSGTINGSYTMRVYGIKIYDYIGG